MAPRGGALVPLGGVRIFERRSRCGFVELASMPRSQPCTRWLPRARGRVFGGSFERATMRARVIHEQPCTIHTATDDSVPCKCRSGEPTG